MRNIKLYSVALLLLAGCTTSKVVSFHNDEFELSTIKTFALRATYDRAKLTSTQQQTDSVLLAILLNQMTFRGYEPSHSPDVFVSYKVSLSSSSESRVDDTYNSRRYYQSRRNYQPFEYGVTTYNYTEGLVLVEVKNPAGKLIWQGSKDFKVKKKVSTREILVQTIREIIASYPEKI